MTDLAMPRKNGIELIRDLRAVKPELPVLVMSGNFSSVPTEDLAGISCISKPFNLATLLREVAHICRNRKQVARPETGAASCSARETKAKPGTV